MKIQNKNISEKEIETESLKLLNKGIDLKEIEKKFNCELIAFKDINNKYKSVSFWRGF